MRVMTGRLLGGEAVLGQLMFSGIRRHVRTSRVQRHQLQTRTAVLETWCQSHAATGHREHYRQQVVSASLRLFIVVTVCI